MLDRWRLGPWPCRSFFPSRRTSLYPARRAERELAPIARRRLEASRSRRSSPDRFAQEYLALLELLMDARARWLVFRSSPPQRSKPPTAPPLTAPAAHLGL